MNPYHRITRLTVAGLTAVTLWLTTITTPLAQTSPQLNLSLSTPTLSITEGDADTYTVRLTTQPQNPVTVTPHVTPIHNSPVTTTPTALTFTSITWNSPLTITVTAAEDDDNLPNTATISHTITGTDTTTAPVPTVTVTVNDNDPPTFGMTTITPQIYVANQNIHTLTLPDAIGGTLPLRYTLTGALPNGLAYSSANRTISGRPTATAATTTYTWTATANNNARTFLTFTIAVHPTDACLRTPAVRDAIVRTAAASTCAAVTTQHLSRVESLSVTGQMNLLTLQPGDFRGLRLQALTLTGNGLQSLPEGIFRGLSSLQTLSLNNNQLTSLPVNVFDGVRSTDGARLQTLYLNNNRLTTLPRGIFAGLSHVGELRLNVNPFTSLPGRLFAGMDTLATLNLRGDLNLNPRGMLQTLPVDIFSGTGGSLGSLIGGLTVQLGFQSLTTLPAGIFNVPRLTVVQLNSNLLDAPLPAGLFDGARNLFQVFLVLNPDAPYTLGVDAVQVGDGRIKARILQAAPFPVMVDWAINGQSGTATIAAGNRTSNTFGTPTTAPASVTLTNARFGNSRFGPPQRAGFEVRTIQPRPGIIASTATLAVNEGSTTIYTVALNTAPTDNVTVTPIVNSANSTVIVSGALVFTPDVWHLAQTVTVTASLDDDTDGERVTLTHTVAGYSDNMRPIVVTVTDTQSHPIFGQVMVPRQVYTVGTAIPGLTLPAAINGDSPLTYRLGNGQPFQTLFPGLTFTSTTRVVSGTPTAATRTHGDPNRRYRSARYAVQDADGQTATLDILIAVDPTPEVLIEPTALTVEEIAMTTYTVSLATRPDENVTLTPTVTPPGALTGATALTFTPDNWFQRQTVTLTAAADANTTNDPATLTHTVTGYGSVTAPPVSITIADVLSGPYFAVPALPGQT